MNVTWPDMQWSTDISHGDIVRENPSEKMEIDPRNLQLLYQGKSKSGSDYLNHPYRPFVDPRQAKDSRPTAY